MFAPLHTLLVAALAATAAGTTADTARLHPDAPVMKADSSAVAAGPRVALTAFAARAASQYTAAATMQRRSGVGRPVALMVVGGAALLVGSAIDGAPGTLFMIGGAVALLYGLYLWLL